MAKENKNISLDEMIVKEGQPLNEQKEELLNIDKSAFAYEENNMVMPGKKVELPTAEDVTPDQDRANDHLVKQLALNKLEKENQVLNSMSDDEKIKDYIFQSEFYRATNDYFNKYHFDMSGKQKRMVKRAIETAWKKGKFKITEAQRQDILYELSKMSSQINNARTTETKADPLEQLSTLNSLINKN